MRIFMALMLFLSGCSTLNLLPSDSALETTGKVATRVVLCPLTICFSEIGLAMERDRWAAAERERQYWDWLTSLPPEQQALALERERNRQQAVGMALFGTGPALISGMNQGFQNMQVKPYQAPPLSVAPIAPITAPRSMNCISQRAGNSVYTNCQ